MDQVIKNFNKQLLYEPEIKNLEKLAPLSSFVVVGMGGSALAAKLLKIWKPDLDITVRTDYGLPQCSLRELQNKLIILSSYSGNTEETLEAFREAKEKSLHMAVIAVGGELLQLAKENNVPYIEMPDTGIEPRMALGFSLRAFLKLLGEEGELQKIRQLAQTLIPSDYEEEGKKLAEKMKNYIPIIYASSRYVALAYIWKIKLNESGKIPAFYNFFPELNHNEMNGFDVKDSVSGLAGKFYFIFLKGEDDPRILKRMEVLEKLYGNRHLPVEVLDLGGMELWQQIFSSIILADWVSYHTALLYGLTPENVPMVEEFKKLILA